MRIGEFRSAGDGFSLIVVVLDVVVVVVALNSWAVSKKLLPCARSVATQLTQSPWRISLKNYYENSYIQSSKSKMSLSLCLSQFETLTG